MRDLALWTSEVLDITSFTVILLGVAISTAVFLARVWQTGFLANYRDYRANLGRGILLGWAAGLLIPGGPYLVFPIIANLFQKGAAPGPVISLLTAKTLVSPIRMLTYEAPLLGWPLTLARFIPGVLLPPVMGVIGQWLYGAFGGTR